MLLKLISSFKAVATVVLVLLIMGCSNMAYSSSVKVLTGTVTHEDSKEPVAELMLSLYRFEKPLLSAQGWEKIAESATDQKGNFSFSIDQDGPFEIRWNPEGNVLEHEFSVDDFEGKKTVEIVHKERDPEKFPWQQ